MAPHHSVPRLITTWLITLLLVLGLSRHALGAVHSDPNWGLSGVRVEVAGISQFAKWLEEAEPDQVLREVRPGSCGALSANSCGLADFGDFLVRLRSGNRWSQINRVNRYVNAVAYRSDLANWGQDDRWVGPGEFFARGGDCEDYAIAKYFALRSLGISKDDLRI
jgi:predicted transglutaminase-like cysteine proteinase